MKEKILNAAFKHFIQYGFARTTLTGIASMLGKQKTALYHYFKNKEAIFDAIIELESENLLHKIDHVLKGRKSEDAMLETYIKLRIDHMNDVAKRYSVLKDELFQLLPQIEKVRKPYHQREILLVANLIQRGTASGVFRNASAEKMASVLVNTLKGLEIPMYVNEEMDYSETSSKELTELLLHGITLRPEI